MLLFISLPGGSEWFVILLVALLLFGKRLPEVAKAMGHSVAEFKKGMQNLTDNIHEPDHNKPLPTSPNGSQPLTTSSNIPSSPNVSSPLTTSSNIPPSPPTNISPPSK